MPATPPDIYPRSDSTGFREGSRVTFEVAGRGGKRTHQGRVTGFYRIAGGRLGGEYAVVEVTTPKPRHIKVRVGVLRREAAGE